MKVLSYDVETTGIPVPGVPSDDPRHPHIASLSAVLDDDNGITQRIMSVLIKPEGRYRLEDFPEAFAVHGITTDRAEQFGVSLEDAMDRFYEMGMLASVLSSYSHHFDFKLIKIGLARHRDSAAGATWRDALEARDGICSMESAANFLIGKKRIKLREAYFQLFKEQTQTGQYHGSMEDVMAHRRIFYALKAKNALLPPKPLKRDYAEPYQGGAPSGEVGSKEVPI